MGSKGALTPVERFFEMSLLGLVTSGYLAVAGSGYLDPATIAAVALALSVRALLIAGTFRFELPGRVLTALTIAYIGFYPLDYYFVSRDFLQATVHLVFFLAVVKILSAGSPRDHVYVAVIAFLELVAAAILSTNLNFFLFLGLFLLFAIASLSSAEIRRSSEKPRRVAQHGLRRIHLRLAALTVFIGFAILGLTGALFFLLPRTATAAFQRFLRLRDPVPSFSNQVDLGMFGSLKLRSEPVMHVRIYDQREQLHLRWRGQALDEFDGRRWFNSSRAGQVLHTERGRVVLASSDQRWRAGRRLMYMVTLRSLDSDVLFFAGVPEVLNVNSVTVVRTPNGSYRLGSGSSFGLKYEALSIIDSIPKSPGALAPELDARSRRQYLRLPALDPRVPVLAREFAGGRKSDYARAAAIEESLRTRYSYSLELPAESSQDPLARFLFERRRGHCEYFASAMAVMLRSIGIPSRLATGFVGGTFNPISEQYLIRASDAHSWVEAYLPALGWTAFDPTPPALSAPGPSWWSRLAMYTDAADTFWQDWVVGYDVGQQLSLAAEMERSSRSFGERWASLLGTSAAKFTSGAETAVIGYGPAVTLLVAAGFAAWWVVPPVSRRVKEFRRVRVMRSGQARASDASLVYSRMLEIVRRRGYEKPAWYTAGDFASSLPDSDLARLVERFTQSYNELRFGGKLEAAAALPSLLDRMERLPR